MRQGAWECRACGRANRPRDLVCGQCRAAPGATLPRRVARPQAPVRRDEELPVAERDARGRLVCPLCDTEVLRLGERGGRAWCDHCQQVRAVPAEEPAAAGV